MEPAKSVVLIFVLTIFTISYAKSIQPLIFKGNEAKKGEIPYQALLTRSNEFLCGATGIFIHFRFKSLLE